MTTFQETISQEPLDRQKKQTYRLKGIETDYQKKHKRNFCQSMYLIFFGI